MTNLMSGTLMQASHQWMTRPADERFISLFDMQDHFERIRNESRATIVASRRIAAQPAEDNTGLVIQSAGIDQPVIPTHWAFGQLAQLAGAPAGYLRKLPAPIAADCMNYGLQFARDMEDVGVLLHENDVTTLRAATGPNYGRIWNSDILRGLTKQFGDGVSGDWRVPGEFGKAMDEVTKENTTLFAGDRNMFVFLADEKNRIEVPNRRNGESGQMARGFFIWNSEVGDCTFGISTFLFDYVCCNRIVWGAEDVREIKIRHTKSAPERFMEEIKPALLLYAKSDSKNITDAIAAAKAKRISKDGDEVAEFLAKRFSKRASEVMLKAHLIEEGRPVETLWDATTAATAYARSIPNQDDRVEVEREAGKIMNLAK